MSCNLNISKTSPDNVFEGRIVIPRDADLPFSVQLYTEDAETGNLTPYDLNGHTVVFEIFKSKHSLEPIVEFTDAVWDKNQSPGQDTPVTDTLERVFLWEETELIKVGIDHWWRFRATDAADVDFIIGRGEFFKERY